MTLRHLALPIVFASFALAACGGDASSNSATTASPTTARAPSIDFNDADVTFAQGMIPHHEQAIEMAEIALDPQVGAGAKVTDLATRIKAAQDPEIELMTGRLAAWGRPMQMDMSDGHDMSSMDGMMSAADMDALAASSGTEFDAMWVEMMVAHHAGAIAMAEEVKASGANADVQTLADQIIAAQQTEIDEMKGLLAG